MRGLRKVRNAAMQAIAVLPNGIAVYPILGAEGEGAGEGQGTGDDGDKGGDKEGAGKAAEDDSDDDDSDDGDGDKDKSSSKIRKLKDENAQRRIAEKNAAKRAEDAEAKLREIENKDKSDLEKLQSDHEVLQGKYDKLFAKHNETIMESEALRLSPRLKLRWKDVDDVLTALSRNADVKVSDDGEIEGVEAALKALAKAKPHWMESEEDGKNKNKNNGNGNASGGNVGSPKGSDRDGSRAALEKKYPSLRR